MCSGARIVRYLSVCQSQNAMFKKKKDKKEIKKEGKVKIDIILFTLAWSFIYSVEGLDVRKE